MAAFTNIGYNLLLPQVAAAVFEECIVKELKGSTRILVTNQLNLLNQCDHIAVIGSPSGEAAGTWKEGGEYNLY